MNAFPPTASVRATNQQREASDPTVSAFVAASAGSGKTKLLIDRLLRLMLEGAEPSRILCLTFTKAAAAEMALRLQRILGEWVTLPAGRAGGGDENPRHHAGSGGGASAPGRCSPRCWTCRVGCGSAPFTRSASLCCGVFR